jgi:peptidoglycan/xylan/chitin deacetylase (PgdA/CDA1 family)
MKRSWTSRAATCAAAKCSVFHEVKTDQANCNRPLWGRVSRREFVSAVAAASAGVLAAGSARGLLTDSAGSKAQIAITLDLEMSRNFPRWEDTHWDYEKGNLDQASKDYTVEVCRRFKQRGGIVHTFVVGQTFEQPDCDWLQLIADRGHPIGNHTYDHVNLRATRIEDLQYRFQRAPELAGGRSVSEVIRENIEATSRALQRHVGVRPSGFRTPGGFADGLSGRDDLQRMLLELGFTWVSSKYPPHAGIEDLHGGGRSPSETAYGNIVAAQAEAQPSVYPSGLVEVPMSPISDIGAFRNGRWQLEDFLKAIGLALDWVIPRGAVFDFLAHPSCLGVIDPGCRAIDLICDMVEKSNGAAEIVSLEQVAARRRGA